MTQAVVKSSIGLPRERDYLPRVQEDDIALDFAVTVFL